MPPARRLFTSDGLLPDGWVTVAEGRRRWLSLVALLGILLTGSYLRFRSLGAAPLWIDEAFTTWAARNFLAGEGFSDAVGAASPYHRGRYTTSLPIAVSFWLLERSEFAARLPMALYGVGTLVVAVLLGRRYGGVHAVLLGAFVAFDPLVLVWARDARMYSPLAFYVLTSLFLFIIWRGDHDLSLSTPYPYVLAVLVLLGQHTHRAYLALGPAVLLVLLVDIGRELNWGQSLALGSVGYRAAVLSTVAIVAAVGYVFFSGVPSILTASPPSTWPDRDPAYYWRLFGRAYPLLRWVALVGLVWLWIHRPEARVLVGALVVSFVIASVTPRKAPRYVSHLAPLTGAVALISIGDTLDFLWRKVTESADTDETLSLRSRAMIYLVPVVIILLVSSPTAAVAAVDATYDPPYHPERSAWDEASAWLDDHAEPDDVIVSTRPEMSMWYFGHTDYFFRQNGVARAELQGGVYVHTRTGTVYLNETSDVRRLVDGDREVWLLAGKKFRGSFTDPEARRVVNSNFQRRDEASWRNIRVYYYDPPAENATQ